MNIWTTPVITVHKHQRCNELNLTPSKNQWWFCINYRKSNWNNSYLRLKHRVQRMTNSRRCFGCVKLLEEPNAVGCNTEKRTTTEWICNCTIYDSRFRKFSQLSVSSSLPHPTPPPKKKKRNWMNELSTLSSEADFVLTDIFHHSSPRIVIRIVHSYFFSSKLCQWYDNGNLFSLLYE